MKGEIHVGQIGVVLTGTVKDEDGNAVDISGATTKQFIFGKPPNYSIKNTRDAAYVTDGTDGKIKYTSQSGDLDEAGKWKMQGYVVKGASVLYTDIKYFQVYDNIGGTEEA